MDQAQWCASRRPKTSMTPKWCRPLQMKEPSMRATRLWCRDFFSGCAGRKRPRPRQSMSWADRKMECRTWRQEPRFDSTNARVRRIDHCLQSVGRSSLWCCLLCGAVWIDVLEFPNQMLRIVATLIFMAWRKRAGLNRWLIALPTPRGPKPSRPNLRHQR